MASERRRVWCLTLIVGLFSSLILTMVVMACIHAGDSVVLPPVGVAARAPVARPVARQAELHQGLGPPHVDEGADDLAALFPPEDDSLPPLEGWRRRAGGVEPEPLGWGPPTRSRFSPGGFQEGMTGVLEGCDPMPRVVGFDCDEPPCLVTLTSEEPFGIALCGDWVDTFGDGRLTIVDFYQPCADGSRVRVTVVTPFRAVEETVKPQDRDRAFARLVWRADRFEAAWCDGK